MPCAKGHKANDPICPMKSKPYAGSAGRNGSQGGRGNGKFRGECNHCGMRGHKASDCFEKSKNAGTRPASNWKSKMTGEANGAAINDDYTPSELNAVAIVGDTGATCDSTASDYGMYDCIERVCYQC
jgi:hypothetical protein